MPGWTLPWTGRRPAGRRPAGRRPAGRRPAGQKVNKSYFRRSETFAPSKLIIFHQGIRFSRSRRPEEAKRTNLSPLAFQLYFKSKNILPGELEMSWGAREELNASLGRIVNESSVYIYIHMIILV